MQTDAEIEKLVQENQGLVRHIWKRYRTWSYAREDLMQGGQVGLVEAARRFRPELGTFGSYAGLWINVKMREALDKESLVTIPQRRRKTHKLWPQDFTPVDPTDYVEHDDRTRGWERSGVRRTMLEARKGSPSVLLYEKETDASLGRLVAEAVRGLTRQEKVVVGKRFGLDHGGGKTLREVGEEMGVTKQRVQQIESGALRKMRVALDGKVCA